MTPRHLSMRPVERGRLFSDESGGGELLAGSSVVVRLGREARRVTTVPRAAVAPDGYVVVVENGRSTVRTVTLGRDVGNGRVEVLSGLSRASDSLAPRGSRMTWPAHAFGRICRSPSKSIAARPASWSRI